MSVDQGIVTFQHADADALARFLELLGREVAFLRDVNLRRVTYIVDKRKSSGFMR